MAEEGGPVEQQVLVQLVKTSFHVRDYFLREEGAFEFSVAPGPDSKQRFTTLLQSLKARGWLAALREGGDGFLLYVGRQQAQLRFNPLIPFALLAFTAAVVAADGWLITRSGPEVWRLWGTQVTRAEMALLYAASLLGIIGIHEMGHKAASHLYRSRSSAPYFIPGIPGTGFPTFGAVIVSGEPMVNRDSLFDIGLAGPLAGLVVTLLVAVPGALTSTVHTGEEALQLLQQGTTVGISLLQHIVLQGLGLVGFEAPVVIEPSPLFRAAWLGFLITFLNLMPAWQLDGGHMARAVFGRRHHRLTTLASVAVLIYLNYWFMALLILLLSFRGGDVRFFDEVSTLSRSRKALYILVLAVAALCAPVV